MYEWLKVVHLLAVISWMAGLLYLPRLLVYHVGSRVGGEQDLTFQVMERRLLKAIMRPAAVVSLLSGVAMIYISGFGFGDTWLVIKGLALLGLFGVHGLLERHVKTFAGGVRNRSATYFRVMNEVPTALMIVVVIMVIIKPFS